MALCSSSLLISMLLLTLMGDQRGTAASFGFFAFGFCFGSTTIIDSIRTIMWHHSVFGSAYSLKITMNNA